MDSETKQEQSEMPGYKAFPPMRQNGDKVEVYRDGEWLPVPPEGDATETRHEVR